MNGKANISFEEESRREKRKKKLLNKRKKISYRSGMEADEIRN